VTDPCPSEPNAIEGFDNPLTTLVPDSAPNVPIPDKAFQAGRTPPLFLRFLCDGVLFRLTGSKWAFNLSTGGFQTGTYVITVRVPDGRLFNGAFVLR